MSRSALPVLIVAVPPMRTLDVFGPAEVFGDANWLCGGDPAYIKSTSFRAAPTAWFQIISARPCMRIGRTGNIAGRSIHSSLPEEDLGRPLALRVAQMMVVFLRRPGGQSQFSTTLEAQTHENRPLGDLLAWLPDNLRRDLSVDTLARRAVTSPRNFARLFKQEFGKTPGRHIEDLRLEAARGQLESTSRSVDEIADACGLASAEVLRRMFRRRLQVTPGQYRASFGHNRVH